MSVSVQRVEINGYSLSNFKSHPDMSEETLAFSADLHHDGEKVGTISNSGRGEAALVRSSDPRHRSAVPDVKTEYTTEFGEMTVNLSVDTVLTSLAEVAQSIAPHRGSVSVIPDPDIQQLVSGGEMEVLRIRGKGGGKPDTLAAAEFIMKETGSTSVAASIDGVLHVIRQS